MYWFVTETHPPNQLTTAHCITSQILGAQIIDFSDARKDHFKTEYCCCHDEF